MPSDTLPPVAQTNLQLFNQLRGLGLSPEDLGLVRRAHDLANALYAGAFQSNDKTFISHGVGVASLVAEAGLDARFVAVALIHNVYGNGDFGDGKQYAIDDRRRAEVRAAVGPEVAEWVERFFHSRIDADNVDELEARFDQLDAVERGLVAIELADYAEKFVDDGVLYMGNPDWVCDGVERIGDRLIALAERLGHAALARRMTALFAQRGTGDALPAALRPAHDRRHLGRLTPRSCRKRTRLALRDTIGPPLRRAASAADSAVHRLRVKLAIRTRLRRLVGHG